MLGWRMNSGPTMGSCRALFSGWRASSRTGRVYSPRRPRPLSPWSRRRGAHVENAHHARSRPSILDDQYSAGPNPMFRLSNSCCTMFDSSAPSPRRRGGCCARRSRRRERPTTLPPGLLPYVGTGRIRPTAGRVGRRRRKTGRPRREAQISCYVMRPGGDSFQRLRGFFETQR